MNRGRRTAARAAGLGLTAALTAALTGCSSVSLQGVPLPGGASLGGSPYQVTVQLRDALDLVPQSSVKVNNVTVGQVTAIDLDPKNWYADVRVEFNGDVKLPANADAQLKQTTLLGEKYIEIDAPTDTPPQGALADGATIPVERTNRFPEIEEIFGALSMLLNGGGVGQVQTISKELNLALDGRTGDTRALLNDLNTLVTTLDGQKTNITRALDGVDRLSVNLAAQKGNLDSVLTDLEPGLKVLNDQRPQLVDMLKSLDKLSDVANEVVDRSQDDLVADLEALRPTLRELARTGDTLPVSLEVLASPPFTDAAIKPSAGDFMNLNFGLDLNLQDLLGNLLNASTPLIAPPDPLNLLPTAPSPLSVPGLLPNASSGDNAAPLGGLDLPGLGGDK
jgi:phospholipid/cholesterol/gamma-HCH transport system substrate-binding protein